MLGKLAMEFLAEGIPGIAFQIVNCAGPLNDLKQPFLHQNLAIDVGKRISGGPSPARNIVEVPWKFERWKRVSLVVGVQRLGLKFYPEHRTPGLWRPVLKDQTAILPDSVQSCELGVRRIALVHVNIMNTESRAVRRSE